RAYVWGSVKAVMDAIIKGIRQGSSTPIIIGEICLILLAMVLRDRLTGLLPAATFLLIVFSMFRLRDAYSYPAIGSAGEVGQDAILVLGVANAFEVVFFWFVPTLVLTAMGAFRASVGIMLAAQWRLICHREDPPSEVRRNFLQRKIASFHMNLLVFAAS